MRLRRFLSRNWGFLLACLIAAWAGLETGGKGSGVLKWLFSPPLTRDAGFHPVDIAGARPLGPVRLTTAEAAAVNERLALAFGAHVPAFRRTSDMAELYELKGDARCDRANLDAAACNRIARIDRFFSDVLAAMHPKTEHLFWFDLTVYHRGRSKARRCARRCSSAPTRRSSSPSISRTSRRRVSSRALPCAPPTPTACAI